MNLHNSMNVGTHTAQGEESMRMSMRARELVSKKKRASERARAIESRQLNVHLAEKLSNEYDR